MTVPATRTTRPSTRVSAASASRRSKDTGPLTHKRMKTSTQRSHPQGHRFHEGAQADGKPFFVWLNATRMHLYTRLNTSGATRPRSTPAKPTCTEWHDAARHESATAGRHEGDGRLENTIVWYYSTDNGPEQSSWPHGATTPFRGEKMTSYEGGVRVPMMVRWPGTVKAGQGAQRHPGAPGHLHQPGRRRGRARRGGADAHRAQAVFDGVNNLDYWMGKKADSARDHFFYYAESQLVAVRYKQWKLHFATGRTTTPRG